MIPHLHHNNNKCYLNTPFTKVPWRLQSKIKQNEKYQNKWVFKSFLNTVVDGEVLMWVGKVFQDLAASISNLLSPMAELDMGM